MATTTTTTLRPGLHHVTMKTTRMDEMIDWYGRAVGMTPKHHGPFGAWMSNDEANHRVALLPAPGLSDDPEKISHAGIHHMAFEYDDVDQLMSTYERLRDDGITPHASLDHGITTSLYYVDPDGNSVELQVDNFRDWVASSQWMQTAPEFSENPIGVSFDPERMWRAWKDGADAAELHRLTFSGELDPGTPLDLRMPEAAADQSAELA